MGRTNYVPTGVTTLARANGASIVGKYFGFGQVQTSDGNRRGKFFSQVTARPTTLGNYNSVDTTFNGDWTGSNFSIEHRITGVATLGQPATGYLYTPEACATFTYLFNQSGHNEDTASNTGRTAAVAHRTVISNAGQGDAMCYNASGFVQGTKAGSTHFLANPAAALFAGDISCGTDGNYLNPYEIVLNDNGFDAAGIGHVINLNRTNDTGAKSAVWMGHRVQSIGSTPADVAYSASGAFKRGLDLSTGTFTSNAAITLKPDQKIYFSGAAIASGTTEANWYSTVLNNDALYYDSASSKLLMLVAGTAVFQLGSTGLTISGSQIVTGNITTTTGQYQVNFTKVVGARETGFSAMTGTANKATVYDTATVTLAQLAERVMSLQAALTTHGLIGA